MKFQLFRSVPPFLLGLTIASAQVGAPPQPTGESNAVGSLAPADVAFDLRLDIISFEKDAKAEFAFVEKTYAKDPRPHVKARFAEYLLNGESWGAPAGREAEAFELAQQALREHSVHALRVVGWEYLTGAHVPQDVTQGLDFLQRAAGNGYSYAMVSLGDAYFRGMGVAPRPLLAEIWFRKAAQHGKPHSLYRLAKGYDDAGPDGRAEACRLYYEAARYGSGRAELRLRELAEAGDAEAKRANYLMMLWYAAYVQDGYLQTRQVREAMDFIATQCPNDPAALIALGRVQGRAYYGLHDWPKAYALFDQAAKLGSEEARAERAHLLAEGSGVTRDVPAALAELRALEGLGNPTAISWLGHYYYWGSLKKFGLPKDPVRAFQCSKRAADLGDLTAQMTTGMCYENGIGTPLDYAAAATYYRAGAARREFNCIKKVDRLLPHIK